MVCYVLTIIETSIDVQPLTRQGIIIKMWQISRCLQLQPPLTARYGVGKVTLLISSVPLILLTIRGMVKRMTAITCTEIR